MVYCVFCMIYIVFTTIYIYYNVTLPVTYIWYIQGSAHIRVCQAGDAVIQGLCLGRQVCMKRIICIIRLLYTIYILYYTHTLYVYVYTRIILTYYIPL